MKQFHFLMALIGLIFVNQALQAQPDPSTRQDGMELKPTYIAAHGDGKSIPPELILEIQRTGERSNVPLEALEQATVYRMHTVQTTFEDKTGNRLNVEDYLGPENTWHAKLNNPDNKFLVSNRNNPGRQIWTYGWLTEEFTASDGTVWPKAWYYFPRPLYQKGENGYLENEGTVDLDCGRIFHDIPEMQGVFIAWYADGCANPSLPFDPVFFKDTTPIVARPRNTVVDPFTGSNWVVSVEVYYQYQQFQPAPQYFDYCGGMGVGFGWNCCPQYIPNYNNCCNCGTQANPQNITNIYEGDTYITNEGDNIINEGDIVIINNPVVDDEDPPVVDEPGGPAPGNTGDGVPAPGNTGDDDGGPNPGNTGMALEGVGSAGDAPSSKISSFEDIDGRVNAALEAEEDAYWANAQAALLAEREASSREVLPVRDNNTNTPTSGNMLSSRPSGEGEVSLSKPARISSIEEAQQLHSRDNAPVVPERPNREPQGISSLEEVQASRYNNDYLQGNNVVNPRDPAPTGGIQSLEQAQQLHSRDNVPVVPERPNREPQGISSLEEVQASRYNNDYPQGNNVVQRDPNGFGLPNTQEAQQLPARGNMPAPERPANNGNSGNTTVTNSPTPSQVSAPAPQRGGGMNGGGGGVSRGGGRGR